MNFLLRIVPLFIGLAFGYPIAINLVNLDMLYKFLGTFITMLSFSYFFTWYNIWMMKRTGVIRNIKELAPNNMGHLLNIAGSLCVAYGFVVDNKVVMVLGLSAIMYADTFLTKAKKKTTKPISSKNNKSSVSPQEESVLRAIQEKKKEDPMAGLKIGSQEIKQRLIDSLKNDKGVHVESLLGILGSLAGYSCHAAFREELVDSGKHKENEVFTIVGGKDGKNYYFGDLPNKPLAEEKVSIWAIISGITHHLNNEPQFDINSIFSHVAGSVGGSDFGMPQVPEKHQPGDIPLNFVKTFWKPLLPIIDKFCDRPMERPILLGLAAQQVIEMGKDVIPPGIAAQLVMECAIPMSKIGPEWLD